MDRNNMSYKNQNSAPTGLQKRAPIPYYAQHEELIRYIHEAWHKITEQGPHAPTVYRNPSDTRLTGFKPFDLENWWGRRAVQNYHNINNRSHQ